MTILSISQYLNRIQYSGPTEPHLQTLTQLQKHHLHHIPFENLDIHWGRRIELDPEKVYRKVILNGRGGFCYELNGMFYELLTRLGFQVKRVAAMVMGDEGHWSADFAHMPLIISLDQEDYLVEVGFGRFSSQPLKVQPGLEQKNDLGLFKLEPFVGERLVVLHWDGKNWQPEFAFHPRECAYHEFQSQCIFHQDHPDSYFRKKKLITRLTPNGRITLTSHELKIHQGTEITDTPIENDAEFNVRLWEYFGIEAKQISN